MKDREFIELLNLYVDHEISPEDALRLEAEVHEDPKRREVYDQYCRMQKACSMLSEETLETSAAPNLIEFPAERRLRFAPAFAGLAAAAAIALVVVNLRSGAGVRPSNGSLATSAAPAARPVAVAAPSPSSSDSMKPVFFVRMPSAQMAPGGQRALFASIDTSSQMAQLNWIGAVHMTPVFSSANPAFLLNPKTDLKAAVLSDSPSNRDDQEPAEMSAFRFQR